MRTDRCFTRPLAALASAGRATLFLVACQQTQQPGPTAAESRAATAEKVFVVFEGPWAIVDDPKDPNSVLALAPKTKLHRDLYVSTNSESTLTAGTYDLSVPAHGTAFSGALDPSFAQAKIDAKSLQRALDDKAGRYVIRLPKPEAYVAAKRARSRVGASYPPDASTEQNYAAYVSYRYNVSTLNGFSLAGTPDTGTFNPLLLQLETPTIRFAIEPAMADNPTDMCHTHSREAFRDTVKFLGLTLYLDFPNDSANCHKIDPQVVRSTKAEAGQMSSLKKMAQLLTAELADVQTASAVSTALSNHRRFPAVSGPRSIVSEAMAAVYLFHGGMGACYAPILFLTTTP